MHPHLGWLIIFGAAVGSAIGGLEGVFYENRDGGHSQIGVQSYPGLQKQEFSQEEIDAGITKGPARMVRQARVVIGNSSMASRAEQGGSLPRFYYRDSGGHSFLSGQYLNNQLFVYPEHRDHDPGLNGKGGYGDLYPTNTPYLVISQGSSGSDGAFLDALLKTLGAFPQEVRERLEERKLLMPVLQAIMRKNYADTGVNPDQYFTSKAHPVVFDGALLDPEGMVNDGAALTLEKVPPLIQLDVVEEDLFRNGRDFFEAEGVTEELGTTVGVIARVFRSGAASRRMKVSAGRSTDLLNRKLTYRWEVLRGDPEAITISPAANGAAAVIEVRPHWPKPESGLEGGRIEIGVFADNGKAVSVPGFITFYMLPNEHRIWSEDGELLAIDYAARESGAVKVPAPEIGRYMPTLELFTREDSGVAGELLRQSMPPGTVVSVIDRSIELVPLWKRTVKLREEAAVERKRLDTALGDARRGVAVTQEEGGDVEAAEERFQKAKKVQEEGLIEVAKLDEVVGQQEEILLEGLRDVVVDGRDLQSLFEEAVERVISGEPIVRGSGGDLNAVRAELVGVGILQKVEGGAGFEAVDRGLPRPRADEYHLQQMNRVAARELVFPRLLDSWVGSRNFVDPFLSTPKLWRDVLKYGTDRNVLGWWRFERGKFSEFDRDGRLVGESGERLPVLYERGEGGKSTHWRVVR